MRSREKSPVMKRGIIARGYRTSATLEQAFWDGLKEIAIERRLTLTSLIGQIEEQRSSPNMSSAIRIYVLAYYRERSRESAKGFESQSR